MDKLEVYLLVGAIAVLAVGGVQQVKFSRKGMSVETMQELEVYKGFVRAQMWFTVVFLALAGPGIIIGFYNGKVNFLLSLVLYAVIGVLGLLFKRFEKPLKSLTSDDPDIQKELESVQYKWDKQMFPDF